MKSNNPHYEIFDFSVCDDHILYPSLNYLFKSHYPKQNIGIFILEISDWEEISGHLVELYRHSLMDSFSIQINVTATIRFFLILKIVCFGANEMNYRYNNLKNFLQKKENLFLLNKKSLEGVFLSILDSIKDHNLRNSLIFREKNKFYVINQEKIKQYFLLINLNVLWILQNPSKLTTLIELLHAINLRCSLVFYSKNLGDSSQSNYYLFAHHPNHSFLISQVGEKLKQCSYQDKISNIFHPFQLGRILTRGPIEMKYLKITTLPPFLNLELKLMPQPQKLQYKDSHRSNSLSSLLKEFPHRLSSKGYYELFHGELILFRVKKLNITSIKNIRENLNDSFEKCLIFFDNPMDFQLFEKKIRYSSKIKKTIPISDLSKLREILKNFKIKNTGYEIASY